VVSIASRKRTPTVGMYGDVHTIKGGIPAQLYTVQKGFGLHGLAGVEERECHTFPHAQEKR
jgi:hypothetical protein